MAKVIELGMGVRNRTLLKRIIRNDTERVTGILAKEGFNYPGTWRAETIAAFRQILRRSLIF